MLLSNQQHAMRNYCHLAKYTHELKHTLQQINKTLGYKTPLPLTIEPNAPANDACGWCHRNDVILCQDYPWWPWPGHACHNCLDNLQAALTVTNS